MSAMMIRICLAALALLFCGEAMTVDRMRIFNDLKPAMRESFGAFFAVYAPARRYAFGRHTRGIIRECQRATEAVERGESHYVIVNIAPRHGKSDVVSRRLPVWHLGRNPDHEVILASYSAELATDMSMDARKCLRAVAADGVFPIRPAKDHQKKNSWGIEGHKGRLNAVGLGGSITGRGANLLIIDDYLKSREEAESTTIRDKVWNCFQNDLFTRLSPDGHAVIIVATRWHSDDLTGRILKQMEADTSFPRFKVITFPAWDDRTGWLFPERFAAEKYEAFQAAVGKYAWNALYQQDPVARHGNMLRADLVEFIDYADLPEGLVFRRGWDLASTERERIKDDPDYTVGTLAAYSERALVGGTGRSFPPNSVFVAEVARGQWTTLTRNDRIIEAAGRDGPNIKVYLESVGGYVDTFNTIRAMLAGKAVVIKVTPQHDKVARASLLEPSFEAGRVFAVRGAWNRDWEKEFLAFPNGSHDDQVDSLVLALQEDLSRQRISIQRC